MGGTIAQTRSEKVPTPSYDSPLLGGNTFESDDERIEQDDLTDFVPPTPHDSPLSGSHTPGSDEGRPNINELMAICTNFSNRVLALETSKTAQELEIRKLKKKERKHGKTKLMFDDSDFVELDVDNAMENVKVNTASIDVSVIGPLNVSTVDPSTCTARDIFEDEMMTIADTLVAIRSTRPRTTSVVIRDVEEETLSSPTNLEEEQRLWTVGRSLVQLKFLQNASLRNNVNTYTRKRRAVSTGSGEVNTASRLFSTAGASMLVSTAGMVQEIYISIPSPIVVKDEAVVRTAKRNGLKEEETMARVHATTQSFTEEEWENIRARVEADEELTQRLQAEERNKYSEVDQAKMLVDLINQRKRYFAARKFLKELFETTMKNANTFVPMETKDGGRASELAAESSQAPITDSAEVGSSKRGAEVGLDHEGSKKQKTNEASESVQEQPDEEEKELPQEDLQ
ncbi:hypothetical protein Tco_0989888 [Tanacetum coccineum]|uniref:Uncharacterized protein n=1 Tax=Tanacetum coccineum TaxID=301880 RepID=A0ABQ5EVK3_9ASTR